MPRQPKLSDMQLVLLSTASQRADGNFFPTAESLKGGESRITKAIEGLIKRGFAAEIEVGLKAPHWREDGDRRLGVTITTEGRAAIGDGEADDGKEGQKMPVTPPPAAPAPPARKRGEIRAGTKQALLVEMLERDRGASLDEITAATAWLPHSARAMLTGLRKRGFTIANEKVDGVRRYRATKADA